MSQNESTPFLVTDAKNLTLNDATRENSPWCKSEYRAELLGRNLKADEKQGIMREGLLGGRKF